MLGEIKTCQEMSFSAALSQLNKTLEISDLSNLSPNSSSQEKCDIFTVVREMRDLAPVSQDQHSLLHLAVSNTPAVSSNSFLDQDHNELFPSDTVVKFLLQAGFDPNSRNSDRETPLHVAAKKVRGRR